MDRFQPQPMDMRGSVPRAGGNKRPSVDFNDDVHYTASFVALASLVSARTMPTIERKPSVKRRSCRLLCRKVVEHSVFMWFTMLLTIYALLGDDLRLFLTQKPADPYFNWMVILCIVVFGVEFILSVIGRDDYPLSFFFWLDLISTASLPLDITTISDYLLSASTDGSPGGGNVRSSKAAKIGAKAGRVVRVLRLVRILKLYKAYYEARALQKRKDARKDPGEEDDWADDDLAGNNEDPDAKESRVGRKLSETTTRRVICLILAMLLGLPVMQTDLSDQAAFSILYGADDVWQHFEDLHMARSDDARAEYESSLLRYVYYHNWFANAKPDVYCTMGECASSFYGHLFWIGLQGDDVHVVENISQLASLSSVDVVRWEAAGQVPSIFNYGTLPAAAREALMRPWATPCDADDQHSRGVSLLAVEVDGLVDHLVNCPDDLRQQEAVSAFPRQLTTRQFHDYHLVFWFDLRPFVQQDAMYNIIMTFCILALLVGVSLVFSSDANKLIVRPVERMIHCVEAIRDNPLIAVKMADEEFRLEEVKKARKKRFKRDRFASFLMELVTCTFCTTSSSAPLETVILEKTIIKLGSLLALGFGEAGANIIGHNMRGGDTAGVDAMIPGTRVECIIGVARIRDFSVATEVLQSKIFTFVNQIAEIVHGVVNGLYGSPNRNNGETFLVIWRIGQTVDFVARMGLAEEASRLAGFSIVAFSKILGCLHRSPLLASYRAHPGLQYRLGSGNRVNLSFGLHAGWAIEGAVGSEFKVDASYLSPNVSIATTVEQATHTYGVSLIVSESVVELCSAQLMAKCRLIDRVIVVGSSAPMDLYCVDLDHHCISTSTEPPLTVVWNTRNRYKARQFLESEKAHTMSEHVDAADIFDEDATIRKMRRRFSVEFFQLFNMGYQNYSQGEWQVARRMLSCTRAILGTDDGPSIALLRFMETSHGFQAPKDWRGVRELATPFYFTDHA